MVKLTERPEGASVQLRKNETTPEGVAHTLPGGQISYSSDVPLSGLCSVDIIECLSLFLRG